MHRYVCTLSYIKIIYIYIYIYMHNKNLFYFFFVMIRSCYQLIRFLPKDLPLLIILCSMRWILLFVKLTVIL